MGAWLTGAIEDNEMHHFFQLGKAMPFCELGHVIFTDQTVATSDANQDILGYRAIPAFKDTLFERVAPW